MERTGGLEIPDWKNRCVSSYVENRMRDRHVGGSQEKEGGRWELIDEG